MGQGLAGAGCSAHALPARAWAPQDCGAPLASQVHALKLAIWFLPLAPLGREQAHAIDIAVLPVNFSDPGLNCPNLPGKPGADRPGGGRETSFHVELSLEETREPLGPWSLSLVSCCSRVTVRAGSYLFCLSLSLLGHPST